MHGRTTHMAVRMIISVMIMPAKIDASQCLADSPGHVYCQMPLHLGYISLLIKTIPLFVYSTFIFSYFFPDKYEHKM